MHELSTMMRLVTSVCHAAEESHAKRITSLSVDVGEMTDIVPAYLEKYFPESSKGTLCEGASFHVRKVPLKVRCLSCNREYYPNKEKDRRCPDCKSIEVSIIQGRDVEVASIDIEE